TWKNLINENLNLLDTCLKHLRKRSRSSSLESISIELKCFLEKKIRKDNDRSENEDKNEKHRKECCPHFCTNRPSDLYMDRIKNYRKYKSEKYRLKERLKDK